DVADRAGRELGALGGRGRPRGDGGGSAAPPPTPCRSPARRRGLQTAPRLRRDRRDHELHQYLESVGDERRGPRREEGRGEGPQVAAVGEDEPRAWLEGGDGLPAAGRPHAVS